MRSIKSSLRFVYAGGAGRSELTHGRHVLFDHLHPGGVSRAPALC